ncbi:hypothetical protein AAVH_42151 [Aphelenchoides avenae]|nr:hypothetical protein AAVH_42151 [Aphelenchus avenae]
MSRLVLLTVCGPNADKYNSTTFFDQVEDFTAKFQGAVEESTCVQPVDDANAFCKLAIDCIFKSVYKPIVRKSNYLRNANKWSAVIVKVSYAINHNNKFPSEKVPVECEQWIESNQQSSQTIDTNSF